MEEVGETSSALLTETEIPLGVISRTKLDVILEWPRDSIICGSLRKFNERHDP